MPLFTQLFDYFDKLSVLPYVPRRTSSSRHDMPLYIHPAQKRYYQISLERDLLGDWQLIARWSGQDKQAPKGYRKDLVDSEDEGYRRLDRIHKRRLAQGYRLA